MPVVQVFTTGGTIASRYDPATRSVVPAVSPEALLSTAPALREVAEVRVEELALESSWNVTLPMVGRWARRIREVLAGGGVDGAVVTHGTDTLEETAFALDLLCDGAPPVVVTGAMRNASETGPDGPGNLLAAARVAADPAARGRGALVVLGDEAHAARRVTKTHTTAPGTFRSPWHAPVARLDPAGIAWEPPAPRLPPLPPAEPEERVHLVKMALGADPLLLRAALDGGARGVVIEGSGAGNVAGGWEPAVEALLAAGVPVVLTSRTGGGRVVPAYGAPGGGARLARLGVILGGDLSGPKARVALAFALGGGMDLGAVRGWFARAVG
jgi:L-asparaginase